ncbi:carbohydrate ABC transporter membrane protein 1, CUT1 family [Leifsonia sp. 98AMF]|jgi:multiple sugar transport system permease protein|uniref:carbohydrate ABC transporter permease n=1 Tax=unclassified Leifsonia TaxID=2663824 RepID=UPI0003746884|nr:MULTISPECIES: sugar ABC transporter permease [unclassified Leifsonia]TDQ02153.1 carbohydrate ABC transporter membrane protein 1 (CUT1 family) [Leifsonia sp. 115AMFTsu3.1]SDH04788.1 carbohydrate ABC transporter membrane protein 1, CUT1 family [Leifsonia sp. 197AMF]SDJ36023.1 carbohydrate ABC transporter membrane protein 1, CUT1 family [Leifsonia sp. 466MF]SDK43466.1 carbohydrate ABC transporter membrane protein 1, CUT1 family [Leifsonia sp. 157MF]SDN56465.1 carbohydrate ABC transporter membr
MTTTSLTRATAPGTPRRGRRSRRDWRGWAFVAPFMVVFAAMIIAPVVYAIYLSLFRQQLIGGNAFVGLGNYVAVFQDEKFWASLGRVSLFLVVQVPIMLVLSLIAALALDSARLHGAGFFRIALFLPYAVPGVVAALIWGFIYGDQFGLTASINQLLGTGLVPLSGQWVLASIGNIVTWEFMGYNMLIFYAALRVIPGELYEAAEIDGAGAFRTVFSIKLPAIRGALVIATIFSIIGSFQLFNEPNLLKQLAPNAISSYFTPNMYAYNLSFAGQQFNYAATVAIVMGVLTAVIAYVVQLRGTRKEAR